jgi:hypothetical protein
MTRRHLLAWGVRALVSVGILGRARRTRAQSTWTVDSARPGDAQTLARIFNGHLQEGKCPYADRASPWTTDRARQFLSEYDATLIVKRDGTPVGFAGLVDYTTEKGRQSILPGVAPEVTVFAIAASQLSSEEQLMAAKRLSLAGARKLKAMGFDACEMLISADRIFSSDNWFRNRMTVNRVASRDGADYALQVRFVLDPIVSDLQAQGI